MKKSLLFAALLLSAFTVMSQVNSLVEAPPYDGGGTSARAPNGTSAHAFMRACELVLQSELTGITSGNTITAFGFTMNFGTANIPVNGTINVLFENTTDVSYQKGTTWTNIVTGMTSVYANVMTIPVSAGATSIVVTLSNPFVYTGGGLYVAWDWVSVGPFDSYVPQASMYRCNYQALSPGCASAASPSSPPTSLGTTSFRPCLLFGIPNPNSNDMQIVGVEAPGRVPAMLNTPHVIKGIVRNSSNTTLNNVNVNLAVGGANVFSDIQTITTLAPGAVTTVNFAAFNPQTPGLNTMTVSVGSDQNNTNNEATYTQSVTCNEWAYNMPTGTYTNPVGFNQGSGIIACNYTHPVTTTLSALRCAISTNTPAIGNNTWGVLLSATGAVLATTNTITISSSMLGTKQVLTFSTPPTLNANTTYYFGFAQPANATGYFPAGALVWPYVPLTYYVTVPLNGGTILPLQQNLGYFNIDAIFTPTITVSAASQTVVCGAQTTVTAISSTNYSWTNGPSTASFIATPTANVVYTVTATNTLGCAVSATAGINITPIPVQASASSSIICLGSPVTLSATGATSFTWNNGPSPNAQTFSDSPLNTTLYTVIGADPSGCTKTSSVAVIVQNFTGLQISATGTTICQGQTVTASANGAVTYTWLTSGHSHTTSTMSEQPLASTIFTVIGANALGCTMTRTMNVTVNSMTVDVASNPEICSGQTASLVPVGGTSYTWTGSAFQVLVVSPSSNTSYTLSGTAANTCTNSRIVTVTVNPLPSLTLTPARTTMCTKESNTVSVSGASSYTWTGGVNNASFVVTHTVAGNPVYTVNGVDQKGCAATGSLTFKVQSCTGLSESTVKGLTVYPNPTAGVVNLRWDAVRHGTTVRVHSVTGALVAEYIVEGDAISVDLSSQSAGLYLATIDQGAGQISTVRIVKD